MAELVCNTTGEIHVLRRSVQVGRDMGPGIRCTDVHVSGVHASIRWSGDSWVVIDLSSTNGTFVDGEAIKPGRPVTVEVGARLAFGGPECSWTLVSDGPPASVAVPLGGGAPLVAEAGLLSIPHDDTSAQLLATASGWELETSEGCIPIGDGEIFRVGERLYRLEYGGPVEATAALARGTAMRFRVSRNEEHVELYVQRNNEWQSLGARACNYLGLTLARHRLKALEACPSGDGWLRVPDLMRMIPDYGSEQHLAVDVHRFRRQLAKFGFPSSQAIERRRGEIRMRTDKVFVEQV